MSNKNHSHYTFPAKPGTYNGHYYHSQMEIRMAKVLDSHKITFRPHQKFDVFNRNGEPKVYTVDFELKFPEKFVGVGKIIRFIEIKGPGCHHDFKRIDWLEFKTDSNAFVVYDSQLKMWEKDGLFYKDRKTDGWR